MKESIRHLPQEIQVALQRLALIIRRMVHNTEMIIVLDRNDVEQQVRHRKGVGTTSPSRLDDLQVVIVTKANLGERRQDSFDKINKRLFCVMNIPENAPQPLYFNISIPRLNIELTNGNLFCINIKRYGILLYDSHRYTLSEHLPADYGGIAELSRKYYDKHIPIVDDLIWGAEQYRNRKNFVLGTYLLCQITECLMSIMQDIYVQYFFRHKRLMHWLYYCRREIPRLAEIFPCESDDDVRLFLLLSEANVSARFRPEFDVSEADFNYLMAKILQLREFAEQVCQERIAEYIHRSQTKSR